MLTALVNNSRNAVLHLSLSLVFTLYGATSYAFGLGQIRIQSAIGQPLRANIPLLGNDAGDAVSNCFKSRLVTPDGEFMTAPQVALTHAAHAPALTISTAKNINEPAVTLVVEVGCEAQIQRDYQILLDPLSIVSLATTDAQQSVPLAESVKRQERSQALSALAMDSNAASRNDQRTARRAHASPTSDSPQAQPLLRKPGPEERMKSRIPVEKRTYSVLRLSSESAADETISSADGLKLSITNSLSQPGIPRSPQEAAALRAAQARFAAVLRDEPNSEAALPAAETNLRNMQLKLQSMETLAAQSRQMIAQNKAALNAIQKNNGTSNWLTGLALSLFVSLGAIVWLVWRIKRIKADNAYAAEQESADSSADSENIPEPSGLATQTSMQPQRKHPLSDLALQEKSASTKLDDVNGGEVLQFNRPRNEMPMVEEISDVMQQAEFWILMQNTQRAVEILEEYGGDGRLVSPLPWLYLFDLYRRLGNQAKYEALAARYSRIFNGKIPHWDERPSTKESRCIEDLPHLAERITALWHTDNIVPYLENILIDDRGGMREGFNLLIYREIIFLLGIAYEIQQTKKYIKPSFYVPRWELVC